MTADGLELTVHFGERQRVGGVLLADALFDVYERHGLAVSALLRGATGFGPKHGLRTDRLLTLSEDLPLVAVALDTRERLRALLPEALGLARDGLVTLQPVQMAGGGRIAAAAGDAEIRVTLVVGRHEQVGGRPAFVAVCDLLRRRGLAGATVLLGVDGTRHGVRTRARFFAANTTVPLLISAVGRAADVAAVLPELADVLGHPPAIAAPVRVCKRDGELLAAPTALGAPASGGAWQRLTVYSSESSLVAGAPIHQALVLRLRSAHLSGATAVRGIWGFHGAAEPHGDRMLQVRRRVPVVTTIVDDPERIAVAFEVVDELTTGHGLVTSEFLPRPESAASPAPAA